MKNNEKIISVNELKKLAMETLNSFEEVRNEKTNALNASYCLGKFHMIADILDKLSNNDMNYINDFVELVEGAKSKVEELTKITNGIY